MMKSKPLGELSLSEYESKKVLKEYGIPCPKEVLLKEEDYSALEGLEYPLFLKVCSPNIIHKTDAGAIEKIYSREEIPGAIKKISKRAKGYKPEAEIQGILVGEDASTKDTRELILGTSKDPDFGAVITLGIGGISTEVYQDVEFRVAPLKERDVYGMLKGLKGREVLGEFRGMEPVNLDALVDTTLRFSRLVEENPRIVEGDINPLFLDSHETKAIDAFFKVRENEQNERF